MQDLIDQLQSGSSEASICDGEPAHHLMNMTVSAVAAGQVTDTPTLQLLVLIQGKWLVFLVDSGSTNSFIDSQHCEGISGVTHCLPVKVQVAGGTTMQFDKWLPQCQWECDGQFFHTDL